VVSDAEWKCTRTPAVDWTAPNYDASAWRAPVVRFRKEFDDTCWHYAALHKYGRLGNSFSAPVMAITASDDPALPNEPTGTSYFRRTFVAPERWSRAVLRAYLDDEGEIYLNGRLVAQFTPTDLVTDIDVTEALRAGPNTLAIRLLNAEYDECVALELRASPPEN
jgi:hypothetical protein